MGAHMTTGLQAYDLAEDASDEAQSALRDTAQGCGVSAADSISRLYRKPQVHFCCTTAAMQAIEALFARCDVPHVCLATGRPDDGPAWRVTTSPKGHRIMLDSRVIVQVPDARASTGNQQRASVEPAAPASKTTATAETCLESPPKDKDVKSGKARRRRRRRHGARTATGDRAALPLSV